MKSDKNRFFIKAFCAAVILLLSASAAAAAETPEQSAVVAVHVNDRNGTHVASGTGFVVDSRGLVATSCRLVAKWIEKVENSVSVEFAGGSVYPMEHVISNNCANNFVIIKIPADKLPSVNIAASFSPKAREKVNVMSSQPSTGKGSAGGTIKTVRQSDGIFQLSIPAAQEYDGSAVFSAKGEVVGIMTFPPRGKNQHIVVPAGYVLKELAKCRKLLGEMLEAEPAPVRSVPPPPIPDFSRPDRSPKIPETTSRSSAEQEFRRAASYEKSNMYAEAADAYRRAVSLRPSYLEAYISLGLVNYKLGKYREAINAYKQALRIKPDLASTYNKLAAAYIISGEYAEALEAFQESLKVEPNNSETHFNLGVAFLIAGDRDGAINEYFVLKDLDTNMAEKLLDLIY